MRAVWLLFIILSGLAAAASSLFYTEIQGVAGYSSSEDKAVYRSGHAHDAMQLNSVGFDYLQKFSGAQGDTGAAALQARAAYNADEAAAKLQIYNAYWKNKTPYGDIWLGHNRAAFGLASYWDTHGDLLQPLPMYGFGLDRDWGVGWSRDTAGGGWQAGLTTGSGMPLRADGNWLFTGRMSRGVLNYDNYTIGLSVLAGQTADTMDGMDLKLEKIQSAALDAAYNIDNLEHKLELNSGSRADRPALAGFYRLGINLLEENRLKLEGQYVYTKLNLTESYFLGAGAAYRFTPELTGRLMYELETAVNEYKIAAQAYNYF
ncbi:hypothetical protein NO1_0237 [Candidatus Termititenax aidoneus]|uniref:Outer membrane protein n=1 Tax=Termititenax aidoneus TaxID=2218524 RepID=A0A388T804_TERA1|nr:hypothetical protein NO1_0237 [Candidatus Termititenax aidoneus]